LSLGLGLIVWIIDQALGLGSLMAVVKELSKYELDLVGLQVVR
jgi:hypothetical protein